jgi:hypothetical protein
MKYWKTAVGVFMIVVGVVPLTAALRPTEPQLRGTLSATSDAPPLAERYICTLDREVRQFALYAYWAYTQSHLLRLTPQQRIMYVLQAERLIGCSIFNIDRKDV